LFGFDIALAVLAFLVILVIFAGVKQMPQGFNYTVERFGRYTKTLKPGLNIIVPFIDRIGAKLNMMEQVLDVPTQEVITKDNATISADGVTFFQILDAARAAYEVRDLERAVLNLTMTNIRTVMGSMDSEGEKQSQILQAEGEKEAAFREAEARERLAQAEAEATRMVSEAISNGDSQAINYFVAQKYTEALTNIASAPNQKVIMMPLEASSLIGSLGGIGSIAKDVFGDGGNDNSGGSGKSPRSSTPKSGVPFFGKSEDK